MTLLLIVVLVLAMCFPSFVRHQIMRDLGHRRAAAEGEEPQGGPPERMPALGAPAISSSAEKTLCGGSGREHGVPAIASRQNGIGRGSIISKASQLLSLLLHADPPDHPRARTDTAFVRHEQVRSTQCSVVQSTSRPPTTDRPGGQPSSRRALRGGPVMDG